MAGPRLTDEQRAKLFAPVFKRVVADLQRASAGKPNLLWALRRKLAKELTYLERGMPTERRLLKVMVWAKQNRRCAICKIEYGAKEFRA